MRYFLENDSYSSLLDKEDLLYDFVGETKVVRNTAIKNSDSIYDPMHIRGFEFTHHDVIENESHRESYKRKIDRLKKDKGNRDITFFYHYRLNGDFNIDLLLNKAEDFLGFYSINKSECELIIFAQEIIKDPKERGIRKMKRNDNIHVYFLKTLEVWGGNNPELFWAKTDDDLIKAMLEEIKDLGVVK